MGKKRKRGITPIYVASIDYVPHTKNIHVPPSLKTALDEISALVSAREKRFAEELIRAIKRKKGKKLTKKTALLSAGTEITVEHPFIRFEISKLAGRWGVSIIPIVDSKGNIKKFKILIPKDSRKLPLWADCLTEEGCWEYRFGGEELTQAPPLPEEEEEEAGEEVDLSMLRLEEMIRKMKESGEIEEEE